MPQIGINIKEATIQKEEVIVGIDLGTTNSLVAIIDNKTGQPVALQDAQKDTIVPSLIHFSPDGSISVGKQAREFLVSDPAHTIFSVKRLMGKSFNDIEAEQSHFGYEILDEDREGLVKVKVFEQYHSPISLSALILGELKARAEAHLGKKVSKAVITVPAYFNDQQRQATRDAGKLAGLDVMRIVNEPTAASLAYGLGRKDEAAETIAVYDLGGGTFDISILRIEDGVFEVISTHGDTYLGGDDFDRAIVQHWLQQKNIIATERSKNQLQALRLLAESAKKTLSSASFFSEELEGMAYALSLDEFEKLIQPFVDKTIVACTQALKDAKLKVSDIDEVVMVGGSTRTKLVQQSVANLFKKQPHNELDPDEVVALGAAIQADILAGNQKDMLLLDITPLSLGIETRGGLMDVIIPRNSKVPTSAGRQYTTSLDGQVNLKIAVYQGERDQVKDNRKLAEFILQGIPAMPAGLPKIDIQFVLDADGILKVTAKELRSGLVQSIDIQPQYGMTDAEMARMLKESIQHAKEDMAVRSLVEARVEGQNIAEAAKRFVSKNKETLQADEIAGTEDLINTVYRVIEGEDTDAIHAAIEALNNFTRPFAERVMDKAIQEAMKGKVL